MYIVTRIINPISVPSSLPTSQPSNKPSTRLCNQLVSHQCSLVEFHLVQPSTQPSNQPTYQPTGQPSSPTKLSAYKNTNWAAILLKPMTKKDEVTRGKYLLLHIHFSSYKIQGLTASSVFTSTSCIQTCNFK